MTIKVSYGSLEQAEAQMRSIAAGINDRLAELRRRLDAIQWDGRDREAYNAHKAEWDNALADMTQILHQISIAIGQAKNNYNETERKNEAAWLG